VTWVGMAVFGRDVWIRNGEAFSIYFQLLGRIAVFGRRKSDGQLVLRPPLSGLTVRDFPAGGLAFVCVMLGSVAFDGYSRTSRWIEWRFELEEPYVLDNPGLAGPRPRRGALQVAADSDPHAIRDVGADGGLYRWRPMAALAGLTGPLAHGGTAGAIIELALIAGVVAIMLAVWVGNRRVSEKRSE
jgi:hypothetical protein